jgi:hypothetical protein
MFFGISVAFVSEGFPEFEHAESENARIAVSAAAIIFFIKPPYLLNNE